MAEAVVLICDRCGRQPAETVTLLVGGQSRKRLIDLCAAHRDELLELSRAPRRGPKTNMSTKRPSANRSTRRRATAKTASPKRSAARGEILPKTPFDRANPSRPLFGKLVFIEAA